MSTLIALNLEKRGLVGLSEDLHERRAFRVLDIQWMRRVRHLGSFTVPRVGQILDARQYVTSLAMLNEMLMVMRGLLESLNAQRRKNNRSCHRVKLTLRAMPFKLSNDHPVSAIQWMAAQYDAIWARQAEISRFSVDRAETFEHVMSALRILNANMDEARRWRESNAFSDSVWVSRIAPVTARPWTKVCLDFEAYLRHGQCMPHRKAYFLSLQYAQLCPVFMRAYRDLVVVFPQITSLVISAAANVDRIVVTDTSLLYNPLWTSSRGYAEVRSELRARLTERITS